MHVLRNATLLSACFALVVTMGCRHSGNGGSNGDPEPVNEHVLTIKGGSCTVVDANGNNKIRVMPGDWVVWQNETGSVVRLTFGESQRLFNAFVLISYPDGPPLKAQVREDAQGHTEHAYRRSDCTIDPPPGLIVCPPNDPNCN